MTKLKFFTFLISFLYVSTLFAVLPKIDSFDDARFTATPITGKITQLNILLLPDAPFNPEQKIALEAAIKVLDTVINSQDFELKIQELTDGKSLFRRLKPHKRDPLGRSTTPLNVLEYLRSQPKGAPFNITIYTNKNHFSSEIATTKGDTLRFNSPRFSNSIVELASTIFHERLHYFGFNHNFFSWFKTREKTVPYYFGDLLVELLSGLSSSKAEIAFGFQIPSNFVWKN